MCGHESEHIAVFLFPGTLRSFFKPKFSSVGLQQYIIVMILDRTAHIYEYKFFSKEPENKHINLGWDTFWDSSTWNVWKTDFVESKAFACVFLTPKSALINQWSHLSDDLTTRGIIFFINLDLTSQNRSTGQISLKIVFFQSYARLYRDRTKQPVTVALWPLGLTTEN